MYSSLKLTRSCKKSSLGAGEARGGSWKDQHLWAGSKTKSHTAVAGPLAGCSQGSLCILQASSPSSPPTGNASDLQKHTAIPDKCARDSQKHLCACRLTPLPVQTSQREEAGTAQHRRARRLKYTESTDPFQRQFCLCPSKGRRACLKPPDRPDLDSLSVESKED